MGSPKRSEAIFTVSALELRSGAVSSCIKGIKRMSASASSPARNTIAANAR